MRTDEEDRALIANGRYVLDEEHNAVHCPDLLTWARWMEAKEHRWIDETYLSNGYHVSTVFLGLDHSFGEGPPLLFETMVFPSHDMNRYSTWDEAKEGHADMCLLAAEKPAIKAPPS